MRGVPRPRAAHFLCNQQEVGAKPVAVLGKGPPKQTLSLPNFEVRGDPKFLVRRDC